MAYRIRACFDFDWVPDGAGGAMLGQVQANNPQFGATGTLAAGTAGSVGAAQTTSIIVAEAVPGGDSPTTANLQTALNSCATDGYTIITTAGAVPGFTSGTLAALIQAWSSGNP